MIVAAGVLGASLASSGCRINDDDVHRWESTAHGPEKLCAVLSHDKYAPELRVESAMALVRMKPRAGRHVGIGMMVETLVALTPDTRQALVAQIVPLIIGELKKPPPAGQAGQPPPADPSFAYKDAAFAMLTHEGTVVIADEALKTSLKDALTAWAMSDFERRLENRNQTFGMEQLLRLIGPSSVAGLPALMTKDAGRLDKMADLVAELGDEKTKIAASTALVNVAKYTNSDEWLKITTPALQAANAAAKLKPTDKQFALQLAEYQDEALIRVFGSMRKVGQRPVIDFCLDFAAQKTQSEKRRQAALAALEARIDRNNANDIKRIIDIASSDAPDVVLDQAFRRLSELPRDKVVEKLYELFKTDKWKVRRSAAMTILRMSNAKNIDEFMSKLPEGNAAKGFAMPEALTYGAGLGDLKEKPLDTLRKYFATGGAVTRAVSLAYYYSFGTSADVGQLQAYEGDSSKLPVCETDADCKWACDVPKEGSKEHETKDVKTVGEFVKLCIEPEMKSRRPDAPKK